VEPEIRAEIEKQITRRERFSIVVEIPLSEECRSILRFAADAAAKLGHRSVGTEHLLLGILQLDISMAGRILISRGVKSELIQDQIATAKYEATPAISAQVTLVTFLAELNSLNSEQLFDYFAKNTVFIDASGQRWKREERWKGFDTLVGYANGTPVTSSKVRWPKPESCSLPLFYGRTRR
jgi:ATP-dependent Clp protease ATP-binding subunit ClpA